MIGSSSMRRSRAHLEHTLQRHLDAAEALIWELDQIDGDPDLEPSNGSLEAPVYGGQLRWSEGVTDGREEQCEGEGDWDEREPDPSDLAVTYHPDDQRQIVTGRFGDHVFYTPA